MIIPFSFEQQKIVTDGLVLNLDTGNVGSYSGSGSTWIDLQGSGNNGTLVNSPSYVSGSGNSSYLSFNGSTQYATSTAPITSAPITINIMFYFISSTTGLAEVLGQHNASSSTNGWGIVMNFGGVRPYVKAGAGSTQYQPISSYNPTNKWTNVCVTIATNDSINLYINGVINSTASTGTLSTFAPTLNYIISNDSFWGIMTGYLSSIQIYNRVLTAQEVSQNFNVLRGRYGI